MEDTTENTGTGTDFHWPPLESDPTIFTDYMKKIGMSSDWQICEIFGLDDDCLGFVPQPCLAVIATMERIDKADGKPGAGKDSTIVPFYMKQTGKLDNACGIIAMLHSILNNTQHISLGEESILQKLLTDSASLNADERATYLEEFKDFQTEHASYASEGQSAMPSRDETKHHFVAFIKGPNDELIELDGTKDGPAVISEHCEDLLKSVAVEIKRRIEDKNISESLSLMALAKNQ